MIRERRPPKNKLTTIRKTSKQPDDIIWVCPPSKNKILATENKSYDNMGNTKKSLNIKGWERVCHILDSYSNF
jgi:hypothetical protein